MNIEQGMMNNEGKMFNKQCSTFNVQGRELHERKAMSNWTEVIIDYYHRQLVNKNAAEWSSALCRCLAPEAYYCNDCKAGYSACSSCHTQL
jgi:hypothetical protein